MSNTIKVVELFAGVGGFRLGLEGYKGKSATSGYKKKFSSDFKVVWSNQWEPSTKRQHASEVYEERFGSKGHINEDIEQIVLNDIEKIPDHDLLVGGFPCQDYSVANTLQRSGGLKGKKGVLWWSIYGILEKKGSKAPNFLLLENVDRLLKSPAKQRGRDFAVMLSSLHNLGYAVEWRVINAADYGFPQRRRRVFIIGYKKGTKPNSEIKSLDNKVNWLYEKGVLAKSFPIKGQIERFVKNELFEKREDGTIDLEKVSEGFNKASKKNVFDKGGLMINGEYWTIDIEPDYSGKRVLLRDIIQDHEAVEEEYFVNIKDLKKWKYLKGAKSIERVNKTTGHKYTFSEGSMTFPDDIDRESRTIITGEGGKSPSRFKHIIGVDEESSLYRRLTPIELERLNMFPDNFTKEGDITNNKRAFFMGNALVVGVVEKIGKELIKLI